MIKLLESGRAHQKLARVAVEIFNRQHSSRHMWINTEHLANSSPRDIVTRNDGFFIAMRYYDVQLAGSGDAAGGHIAIYCGAGDMLISCTNARISGIVCQLDPDEKPFRALALLLDEMTEDDVDALERMELNITALEDGLITERVALKAASARIIALRRAVLKIKRYYEQLDVILDRLCENENGAVTDDALKLLVALGRRIDRLIESTAHMSECIAQASDTYQAQIDIEQNQIMKIFTVLSAVFMPLTLIAGWYGMNFIMPEYGWPMGYAYVALLSVAVCALSFFIFKRKNWF